MPKIRYIDRKFSPSVLAQINKANEIILEYARQGFELTLRQLYYQFVARDLLPNTLRSYKNLGSAVNDGRLAGLIDWDHISDITRELRKKPSWENPEGVLAAVAQQYHIDMWENQKYRPEVWIEKDALLGVIERTCRDLSVPYFSCRGYTSQSEMWAGAQRLRGYIKAGQIPVVFHFGDHDPSGKDMTRDIVDRLKLFMGNKIKLERMALNMDQIEKYNPPPNPAKLTDSRSTAYVQEFGDDSWELDALEPKVITGLVRQAVTQLQDKKVWDTDQERLDREKALLAKCSEKWELIAASLERDDDTE